MKTSVSSRKHALGVAVRAEHDDGPDRDRGDRHRDVARHAEQLERGADAGELRDDEADVGDDEAHDRERGDPQRELLADQRHRDPRRCRHRAARTSPARPRAPTVTSTITNSVRVAELRSRPTRRWRCHRRRCPPLAAMSPGRAPRADRDSRPRRRAAPRLGGGGTGDRASRRSWTIVPVRRGRRLDLARGSAGRARRRGRRRGSGRAAGRRRRPRPRDEPRASTNRSTTSSSVRVGRDRHRLERLAARSSIGWRPSARPAARTD